MDTPETTVQTGPVFTIKTASDLKFHVENNGHEPHFFTRSSMKFFGDRMSNYGVRLTKIDTYSEAGVEVYELYRRRAVKHGLASGLCY